MDGGLSRASTPPPVKSLGENNDMPYLRVPPRTRQTDEVTMGVHVACREIQPGPDLLTAEFGVNSEFPLVFRVSEAKFLPRGKQLLGFSLVGLAAVFEYWSQKLTSCFSTWPHERALPFGVDSSREGGVTFCE